MRGGRRAHLLFGRMAFAGYPADVAPKRTVLCEAQMVGITRLSPANQASLCGNLFDVFPVTNSVRLRQHQHALVDHSEPLPFFGPAWLHTV